MAPLKAIVKIYWIYKSNNKAYKVNLNIWEKMNF